MKKQEDIEIQFPGITILLPLFNAARYIDQLEEQIDANLSINDEVVIVDDCSQDSTLHKLEKWQRKNTKIRVLRNPNKGFVNALNLGVSEASNEWIARWDQDDLYSNERLKLQREYLTDKNVAVFSDFSFISSSGKKIGSMQTAITNDATKLSILSAHRTAHPSAIFSKGAFLAAEGYRNKDFLAEDISLWLRLSRLGNFASTPNLLLNYRVSPTSMTGTSQKQSYANKDKVIREIKLQEQIVTNLTKDWSEVFDLYDCYSFASRRKILLLLDLINASRNNYKINPKLILNISSLLLTEKHTVMNISQLYLERNSRKKARKYKI